MSAYVVDASVAAKWFFREMHRDAALRLLDARAALHAPDFLLLELDHVLRKRIRRGLIGAVEGDRIRTVLRSYPIAYTPFRSLQDRAYSTASRTGCTVYDCLYVALAVGLGERLVTADRRLYDGLAPTPLADHVLWVEDVPEPGPPAKRRDPKGRRNRRS